MIDKEFLLGELKRYLDTVMSSSNDSMTPAEVDAFELKYVIKFTDKLPKDKILAMDGVAKRSGSVKMFAIIVEDNFPIAVFPLFGDEKEHDYIFGYGHMNKEKQNTQIGISIPDVAEQLMHMNYGQQRMLAEIVRLREQNPSYFRFKVFRDNTQKLREMLEQGWH